MVHHIINSLFSPSHSAHLLACSLESHSQVIASRVTQEQEVPGITGESLLNVDCAASLVEEKNYSRQWLALWPPFLGTICKYTLLNHPLSTEKQWIWLKYTKIKRHNTHIWPIVGKQRCFINVYKKIKREHSAVDP